MYDGRPKPLKRARCKLKIDIQQYRRYLLTHFNSCETSHLTNHFYPCVAWQYPGRAAVHHSGGWGAPRGAQVSRASPGHGFYRWHKNKSCWNSEEVAWFWGKLEVAWIKMLLNSYGTYLPLIYSKIFLVFSYISACKLI